MNTEDRNTFQPEEEKLLIEQAKENKEAFAKLYETYFQRIYNYILHRTSDIDLTEDLTSQVFMKVLDNIHKFEWRGLPFSAWLYRIASNEIMTYYRQNKHVSNTNFEELEFIIADEGDSPLDMVKSAEKRAEERMKYSAIRNTLDKLKPKYAEIIVLKYFEKKENDEIAMILNTSEGNIRIRLHRAIKKIKKLLINDE